MLMFVRLGESMLGLKESRTVNMSLLHLEFLLGFHRMWDLPQNGHLQIWVVLTAEINTHKDIK